MPWNLEGAGAGWQLTLTLVEIELPFENDYLSVIVFNLFFNDDFFLKIFVTLPQFRPTYVPSRSTKPLPAASSTIARFPEAERMIPTSFNWLKSSFSSGG